MPFHSLAFIFLFLPITVCGYFLINRYSSVRAGKLWLIGASLVFYGCWNLIFIPILLFSIIVNFCIGIKVRPKESLQRKRWLVLGIVFNIVLLAYFKYANFFIANIDLLFVHAGLVANVILPLGVSFFTLQQVAFLVDTYEGITDETSFLNYLLFVTFFPYLTSGPITPHREVIPQLQEPANKSVNYRNVAVGLFIFSIGLFKKVMIAGNLDVLVSAAHTYTALSFLDAWLASFSYMLQLYFDFSGYSDMAIGLGLMFNVMLPINFNSPLKAANIVEFWRRWHITLANFMRAYIFTAIMRSRPKATFEFSLWVSFITMVVLGIWHGAGWNYVLFGVMHGLAVVIFSIWQKFKIKLPKPVGWFLLINFINLSLIPIRSVDLTETMSIMKGMIGGNGFALPPDLKNNYPNLEGVVTFAPLHFGETALQLSENALFVICLIAVVVAARNSMEMAKSFRPTMVYLFLLLFLFMTPILNISHVKEFIYFQF